MSHWNSGYSDPTYNPYQDEPGQSSYSSAPSHPHAATIDYSHHQPLQVAYTTGRRETNFSDWSNDSLEQESSRNNSFDYSSGNHSIRPVSYGAQRANPPPRSTLERTPTLQVQVDRRFSVNSQHDPLMTEQEYQRSQLAPGFYEYPGNSNNAPGTHTHVEPPPVAEGFQGSLDAFQRRLNDNVHVAGVSQLNRQFVQATSAGELGYAGQVTRENEYALQDYERRLERLLRPTQPQSTAHNSSSRHSNDRRWHRQRSLGQANDSAFAPLSRRTGRALGL